jgi:hypothetical protein
VDHLERSQRGIEDGDATHHFLQMYFLHWFEAMSLINETSLCARLVARLQSLVMVELSYIYWDGGYWADIPAKPVRAQWDIPP